MFNLQRPRRTYVSALFCLAMLLHPTACSTYVEYEPSGQNSSGQTTSGGDPTPSCTSTPKPAECFSDCGPFVQFGDPCMVEGQVCTRPEGDCSFEATCTNGQWLSNTSCMEPPPPPGTCVRCAKFAPGEMGPELCAESVPIFNNLMDCICERGLMDPVPGCKEACMDSVCTTIPPKASPECATCIQSDFCNAQLSACLNDI